MFGHTDRHAITVHGDLQAPVGVAFFCPECSVIWACCPVSGEPTYPLLRPCEQHSRTFYDHGGSLWLSWDKPFNQALPPAILRRETALAIAHFERYHDQFAA